MLPAIDRTNFKGNMKIGFDPLHNMGARQQIFDAISAGLFLAQRVDSSRRFPFWDGINLKGNPGEKKLSVLPMVSHSQTFKKVHFKLSCKTTKGDL